MLFDTPENLTRYLEERVLDTCYIIYSHDNFLTEQTRTIVKQRIRKEHTFQNQVWDIHSHVDWEQIRALHSPSLFDHHLLIDLRWNQSFTLSVKEALEKFLDEIQINHQTVRSICLVSCLNIPLATYRTHWFQQLLKKGTFISLRKPNTAQFPHWLATRLAAIKLHLDEKALLYLSRAVENNFIAIEQIIQKLRLVYTKETPTLLNLKQLKLIVADDATFEIHALVDAIMVEKAERCWRILNHLRVKNAPTMLILAYLVRLLRLLSCLYYATRNGMLLNEAFKKYRVWKMQQAYFQKVLPSCSATTLKNFFQFIYQTEQMIKGAVPGDSWQALEKLVLNLACFSKEAEKPCLTLSIESFSSQY